ncbi:MAG: diacylglycerol kinase family protein [Paracoccaceae bacterium]|nr:diacylglycerol kinase family protein [Paracoccaceae bacterium]
MASPLTARLRSFRFALKGLGLVVRTQPNARIHLLAAAAVVLAGLAFGIARADWLWIASAIALVWFAEAMNTGFEHLCDAVSPEVHPSVERAKDIAAGAVLIAAGYAVVVGVLVFAPYLSG